MIKAIIFDADGVLIHREKYFSKVLEEEYNIPWEKSGVFFQGEFVDCLIGKADLKQVLPKYLEEWGMDKSLEEFIQYWFEKERKTDDQLLKYINDLKNKSFKLYIATNNEKYRTEYLKNEVGLGNIVHKVYGSGHVGLAKPDQNFFKHIIDEQNLKKDEVLFWDDDQENIDGAKAFGIHAELYTTFEDFKQKMDKYFNRMDPGSHSQAQDKQARDDN